jgi:hypothetical protein
MALARGESFITPSQQQTCQPDKLKPFSLLDGIWCNFSLLNISARSTPAARIDLSQRDRKTVAKFGVAITRNWNTMDKGPETS